MVETTIVNRREAGRFHAGGDGAFRILALDGGGVRGIYPAQVLAGIEDEIDAQIRDCFDLIAGASTGSIVAGAAAAGVSMVKVVELFESKSQSVFSKRPFRWPLLRSKYPMEPLRQIVEDSVRNIKLGEIATPLMITSSNVSTGGVQVFKSRYLVDLGEPYVRDGETLLSDAIMASCAAPSYFDPVKVGDSLLADGGLWANNPSIIALTEALSKFRQSIDQVHILSIGTGHAVRLYRRQRFWGLLTGWERQKLVSYVMGLQSQASTNMAKLILGNRFLRLDPEIEDWSFDDVKCVSNLKAMATRDFTNNAKRIMSNIRRIK